MAINRSQLAKFLPDHESIRQFEQAFSQIGDNTAVTDQLVTDLGAAETMIAAQALLISAAQAEIDAHEALNAAHGATGAVVGTTNTQTLTNKTLSAPVLTGVADLQGGALKFPATQVPSANPNTLDDYEEGAFTPYFNSDATPPTVTYATQFGRYTKIGNLVYLSFGLQVATTSGGTGNLLISGIPFPANATGNHGFSNAFVFDFVNQPTAFILSAGATSIYLYRTTATNTLSPTSDLKATSYCYLSGFYMTA